MPNNINHLALLSNESLPDMFHVNFLLHNVNDNQFDNRKVHKV